jgi:D-serine deaminase-like pyridoxal phosphate-dependent protein
VSGAPIAVEIDPSRLDRNIRRFHDRAAGAGVAVRPHVKGHMTVEIARRQMRYGACGIAVVHVAEARAYLAAGVTDILMAHPWREPWRWRLMAGLAADCRLSALVDRVGTVRGLARAAAAAGSVIGVRVRLGDDDDVAAVADDELVALARAAHAEPSLRLDGVHGYQPLDAAQAVSGRVGAGRAAAAYVTRIAGVLRARGLPCPVAAVSGTPTAEGAVGVPGVTEVCAGAYALQDTGMAAIGVCAADDIAVSVTAADPAAADPILAAYPYPWQGPAAYARAASSAPAHAPVHPPHVCALVRQIDAVTVRGAATTWPITNRPDRPG